MEEFSEDLKKEIRSLIRKARSNCTDFTQREVNMLYHWLRNKNSPEYAFLHKKIIK